MFADASILPDPGQRRSRIAAALATLALQGLVGVLLIFGLSGRTLTHDAASMALIAVPPEVAPPPRETPRPPPARTQRKAGRAAPPALRARAAAIVAPPVVILPEVPPPVLAAVVAGPGSADHAGAAAVPGPGSGLAGAGDGTGSGADGDGTGSGGSESRYRSGRIREDDFPPAAYEPGVTRTAGLRYVVRPDGRIGDCAVTRPSGNAAFDAALCPLLRKRLRFWPARDAAGRKVADTWTGEHTLASHDAPPSG